MDPNSVTSLDFNAHLKEDVRFLRCNPKIDNIYRLVYNQLDDDCDDSSRNIDEIMEHFDALNIEGDGISSDPTTNNKSSKHSRSDSWSLEYGSSDLSDETELRISSNNEDRCMEDTFENEIKEARLFRDQFEIISPIRRFDEECSAFNSRIIHSTPIKHWNATPHTPINISNIPSLDNFPTEDDDDDDDNDIIKEQFTRDSSCLNDTKDLVFENNGLSQNISKRINKYFLKKLRIIQKRINSENPQNQLSHPIKFDSNECFFDDDVVHLCKTSHLAEGNTFGGDHHHHHHHPHLPPHHHLLRHGVGGQMNGLNKDGILSEHVQFDPDDDYEQALSQDPGNIWTKEKRTKHKPPLSRDSSKQNLTNRVRRCVKRRQNQILMTIIIMIATLVSIVVILCHVFSNLSQVVQLNSTRVDNQTIVHVNK